MIATRYKVVCQRCGGTGAPIVAKYHLGASENMDSHWCVEERHRALVFAAMGVLVDNAAWPDLGSGEGQDNKESWWISVASLRQLKEALAKLGSTPEKATAKNE